MDHSKSTSIRTIFDAEAIVAGATAYSEIISVGQLAGNASIQITLTGTGIAKFEWIASLDEDALIAAFVKVNNANDIVTAMTVGTAIYSFTIKLVPRLAIRVTETGGLNAIGVTAIIALQ